MNATEKPAATLGELQALAELCSEKEWRELVQSDQFLSIAAGPVEGMEDYMSKRLGRKISVTKPSVKNSGDETL